VPRNPKALALDRAKKAAVNLAKAEEALDLLRRRRQEAALDLAHAGASMAEIGRVFNVSRPYAYKMVTAEEQRLEEAS